MIKTILAAAIAVALGIAPAWADPASEILDLERQAMDGWLKGNPDPQLAISDPQITLFHTVVNRRLQGLPELKELYERYRSTPLFNSYKILEPNVRLIGDVAVLTYMLERHVSTVTSYWKGTHVYRKTGEGWRVIHTHWSEAEGLQP